MLGILRIYKGKCKFKKHVVAIDKIRFLEIFVNEKKIKKALKEFNKSGIRKICTNYYESKLFKRFHIEKINHKNIMYNKKYDILRSLLKEKNNVFVYARNITEDIFKFLEFLPQVSDNIFLDLGYENQDICEYFLKNYGVSVDCNAFYINGHQNIACYFDKPSEFLKKFTIINFSKYDFHIECISDVLCETEFFINDGSTDVTAICNVLSNYVDKNSIEIKKIF